MIKNHSFHYVIFFGIISISAFSLIDEKFQHYYWAAGCIWGALYLWYFSKADNISYSRFSLISILLLHLCAVFSNPILEDDFYRYSWDGRNIRLGNHPYSQSPFEQVSGKKQSELLDLSFDELEVEEQLKNYPAYTVNINYPMYRTVYPPLAQLFFTSEAMAPDSNYGWIALILIIDLLLIYLLVYKSSLSFFTVSMILTNPLLVKEGLNSLHFDFLIVPLLLLWLCNSSLNCKAFLAGLISGLRPWYLVLYFWEIKTWKWKSFLILALTVALPWVILLCLPGFPASGFSSWKAFVRDWEFNALFFEFLRRALSVITDSPEVLRAVSWGLGFLTILFIWLKTKSKAGYDLLAIAFWLFFLPTVNPWYLMPIAVCLLTFEDRKLKAIAMALCVSLPLAYKHYNHLEPWNYLHWSWSLLVIFTTVIAYFVSLKGQNKELFQDVNRALR